jgi:hypothetical protein
VSDFPTHIIRDLRHKAIGASEKAVLYSLADRMQSLTDGVWPTMNTLAADSGLSEAACRRITSWFVSVGIIVESNDDRRTKVRRIDFERIGSLPKDLARQTSGGRTGGTPVAPRGSPVSPAPRALGGTPVAPTPAPVPDEGNAARPKGPMKVQVKDPEKERAPVAAQAGTSSGMFAALGLSPSPAPANKPANASRAGAVRKFTDGQLAARDVVYAFWKKTYLEQVGVEPIVGNVEVGQMVNLLKKIAWNSEVACELITNAFGDVFFRERIRTIGSITANPSKYQTPPATSKPRNAGQTDIPEDFFEKQDRRLASEYGQ